MPLLRPTTGRLSLAVRAATRPRVASAPVRSLSATASRRAGDSHGQDESPYEPPTGWLWGIKPGEKYEKEGWENLMFYGFIPSVVITGIVYAFKPDTTLDTWALEEARRRLEAEGILKDPYPDHKLPIDEYTSTREGKHPPV